MKTRLYFAIVILISSTSATASDHVLINGAGATFPYPLYSKWMSEYQKVDPMAQLNYQSIGSGGGIRQFSERTIDFGATDLPMTNEQLAKAPSPVLHVPTVLGAVVITYNLPGVTSGLKLTPEILADIFLGKITKWNDPALVAINPGIALGNDPVLVIRRSDGSGTTGVFTDYLAKVSPEWKARVGQGTSVNWPIGLGGKGNEGVAGFVKQMPGSIGYVELVFAERIKLSYAALKNKAGHFVLPTTKSVSAAAAGSVKSMPEDFRILLTNAEGADSYPISAMTYLLVFKTVEGIKGKKLVQFLNWAVRDGQKYAEPLSYAPLPEEVVKKIQAKVSTIVQK